MRSLLPITALVIAASFAPSPASGYGLYEICFGRARGGCSCGCEAGCACEPGCGCGCDVGRGCAAPAECGGHVGGGCGGQIGCACEPGCGCGAGSCTDGRKFAGQKWQGCGECCGPPNCRCVEPNGRCRPNCCEQCIDYCQAKRGYGGCCQPAGGCGGRCGTACGCAGCCEPACGCGDACGCGGGCHDGGGTLWFKQCGFCQPCWEVLDVLHSISNRGGCCGCNGCSSELYWSEWHNDPPRCCDPCDRCGNWTGPTAGYRAPYAHPYGPTGDVYAKRKTTGQAQVARRAASGQPQSRAARQPKSTPTGNFRR